jgi:hypothetical protein
MFDKARVLPQLPPVVPVHLVIADDCACATRMGEVIELLHQIDRRITARFDALSQKENKIMALVQVEQGDLDNLATALQTDDAGILQAIADLEAKVAAGTPLAPADLTALRSAVDATAALIPSPVPPPAP